MTPYFNLFSVSLAGLILGSISNILIYQLPRKTQRMFDRSTCTTCHSPVSLTSMIPILGFILQKGKYKDCQHTIPSRYLIVELITILAFIALYLIYPPYLFLKYAILFLCLHCLFWTDIETKLLPDGLTFPLLFLGLLDGYVQHTLSDRLLGLAFGILILWGIGLMGKWFYKMNTIGFGDVKLLAGLGAWIGLIGILKTTYLSFLLGGIIGVCLIVLNIKSRKEYIPFGPFIILSFYLTWFWDPLSYVF